MEYDIVMVTADEWSGLERVRHRIAHYFSKDHKVLFIENPRLTFLSLLRDRSRLRRVVNGQRITQVSDSLFVYSPPLCLPFWQNSRLINGINNCWLNARARDLISDLDLKNVVMWYFHYNHASMIGRSGEALAVYTAHDAWEEKEGTTRSITEEMERDLISKVDVVFYTGLENFEKKRVLNKDSFYIPHGAPDPIDRIPLRPMDLPRGGKVLGYWGLVDESSIDRQLMEKISDAYPDDHIVLIGRSSDKIAGWIKRSGRANIHLLGQKERNRMDEYLAYFDVGLIPYPRIPFRLSSSPLKVYDYLAYGLPVVSIGIRELEAMKDLVYTSADGDSFINNIRAGLSENNNLRERRRVYCRQNTWGHRLDKMKGIIENRLSIR